MKALTASRLAWSLWGLCAVVTTAAVALILLNPERTSVPATVLGYVVTFVFPTVGALIAAHRPENAIGWIFLAIGVIFAFGALVIEYAWYSVAVRGGSLPLTAELNAATSGGWAPALGLIAVYALLLFPDGHLPSNRWRPVPWIAGVGIALVLLSSPFIPGNSESFPGAPADPFASRSIEVIANAVGGLGGIAFLAMIPISATALILRFRRSRGEEHDQLKWFAYGGALMVAGVLVGIVLDAVGHPDARSNVIGISVLAVPISAGIAILRYRLYDIDLVISRTVVFALLAAFITVVYAGVVVGVGTLVGSRGGAIPSAIAAAVVAVAFQPVRTRARHLANRLVYGKRATPYEVLSEFSERVSGTYSTEDVLPRMAQILANGTGASVARVWLRVSRELRPAASWPSDAEPAGPLTMAGEELPPFPSGQTAFPVTHQAELLGALTVEMPPTEPIAPGQDKLVRDLASQAGLVLRNVRLTEELKAKLVELQASRQRLVAAQDEERRKLERNLHDGAQQQLVAVSVKVRLAHALASKDPEKMERMLADVQTETQEALETLRDLARGIYPPLLADQGLPAALEAQARKAPLPVSLDCDGVGRYGQEAEAAVYFCCLEALQNVAKYANASRVQIRLREQDRELVFEVTDDGRGFDPSEVARGAGTTNMADRLAALDGELELRSAPGKGTTVTGRVGLSAESGP